MSEYEPTAWQAEHPCGSRMTWVGISGRGIAGETYRVRVGKAARGWVRVRFLSGPAAGQWQQVHPDGLVSR